MRWRSTRCWRRRTARAEHVAEHAGAALARSRWRARDGARSRPSTGADGRRHWVRLLSYIDGQAAGAGQAARRGAAGRPRAASWAGWMARWRATTTLPLHRTFHWDVAQAANVIGQYKDEIADPQRRALIERLFAHFAQATLPRLPRAAPRRHPRRRQRLQRARARAAGGRHPRLWRHGLQRGGGRRGDCGGLRPARQA